MEITFSSVEKFKSGVRQFNRPFIRPYLGFFNASSGTWALADRLFKCLSVQLRIIYWPGLAWKFDFLQTFYDSNILQYF